MGVYRLALQRLAVVRYLCNNKGHNYVDTLVYFKRGMWTSPVERLTQNLRAVSVLKAANENNFPRGSNSLLSTCSTWNPSFSKNQWLYTPIRLKHTSGSGSNDNELQKREMTLPPLMTFPNIVWPRLINAIRNWFFITFIIKPYFDKEFSMQDFIIGAKEAVAVVSNKLSEGKVDDLEGLVDSSALVQIKQSISTFSVYQQQLLNVAAEDIFFAFPYQIGIIIPDEPPRDEYPEGVKPPPQTRHVEITVCLHVLRGLAEKQKSGETGAAFNFQEFAQDEKNKNNVMICNYRFFKDFTEGSPDPTWIINMVNHFLPADISQR